MSTTITKDKSDLSCKCNAILSLSLSFFLVSERQVHILLVLYAFVMPSRLRIAPCRPGTADNLINKNGSRIKTATDLTTDRNRQSYDGSLHLDLQRYLDPHVQLPCRISSWCFLANFLLVKRLKSQDVLLHAHARSGQRALFSLSFSSNVVFGLPRRIKLFCILAASFIFRTRITTKSFP